MSSCSTLCNYPSSFYKFNTMKTETFSGKPCTNDIGEYTVKEWVEKVKYAILTEGKPHSSICCGNTAVVGVRYGSNVEIYVMKNYQRDTFTVESK